MKSIYETVKQDTNNDFYQKAYDISEKRNHVSNQVSISIDKTRETNRLEVLTVSSSEYIIKNADEKDKTISWLEVQGTGIYTVDLSASEFIVDSNRQYVLVRIPKPVLTNCTISDTGKQFFKNTALLKNGSISDGVRLSQEQRGEGRAKLEDSLKQNRDFYIAATNSAKTSMEALVREWNPNIPDLKVDVEFIEND